MVLILVLAALASGWLIYGRAGTSAGSSTLLHLEPFVLNLADPQDHAYLRVGIDLQIAGAVQRLNEGEKAALVARARDTILGILTQRGPEDLLSAPGKQRLKQDLARVLQQRVPELHVQEVYFTEFLIQQ